MNTDHYHDSYQIYELLDKSYHVPPKSNAMRDLFFRRPSEAKRKFLYGQTLLHKCFEHFSNESSVIDVLLEAYPQAVRVADDHGYLPIHCLLTGKWGETIVPMVSKLMNLFPDSLLTPTSVGELPLHLAAKRTETESVVEVVKLLLCFPETCQIRDHLGNFPLDMALQTSHPIPAVIQLFVDTFPVVLSFPDDASGSLLLHRMLRKCSLLEKSTYDEIVEILVSGCESSLRIQDSSGNTPLFLACTHNHSLSQIYSLVRKWPEQITPNRSKSIFDATVFNCELLYPSLISKSIKLSTVKKWLLRDPGARLRRDLHGRLPIHYAVTSTSGKSVEIVKCLLFGGDESPEESQSLSSKQLTTKDANGRLPIHVASASPWCPSEILKMIIDEYSQGLMAEDNDGRLPWHYGECSRQDLVFETTAELFPEMEVDLDLVPEEIQWDILSVKGHES